MKVVQCTLDLKGQGSAKTAPNPGLHLTLGILPVLEIVGITRAGSALKAGSRPAQRM